MVGLSSQTIRTFLEHVARPHRGISWRWLKLGFSKGWSQVPNSHWLSNSSVRPLWKSHLNFQTFLGFTPSLAKVCYGEWSRNGNSLGMKGRRGGRGQRRRWGAFNSSRELDSSTHGIQMFTSPSTFTVSQQQIKANTSGEGWAMEIENVRQQSFRNRSSFSLAFTKLKANTNQELSSTVVTVESCIYCFLVTSNTDYWKKAERAQYQFYLADQWPEISTINTVLGLIVYLVSFTQRYLNTL